MLGSMYTPDNMEHQFTLLTATARHDQLRTRDALAPPADPRADGDEAPEERSAVPLNKNEALELLALGELIARKAGYGRQLGGARPDRPCRTRLRHRPGQLQRRRVRPGPGGHGCSPGCNGNGTSGTSTSSKT